VGVTAGLSKVRVEGGSVERSFFQRYERPTGSADEGVQRGGGGGGGGGSRGEVKVRVANTGQFGGGMLVVGRGVKAGRRRCTELVCSVSGGGYGMGGRVGGMGGGYHLVFSSVAQPCTDGVRLVSSAEGTRLRGAVWEEGLATISARV